MHTRCSMYAIDLKARPLQHICVSNNKTKLASVFGQHFCGQQLAGIDQTPYQLLKIGVAPSREDVEQKVVAVEGYLFLANSFSLPTVDAAFVREMVDEVRHVERVQEAQSVVIEARHLVFHQRTNATGNVDDCQKENLYALPLKANKLKKSSCKLT